MLHRLELADGLAELLARLGVLHRDFHDALHAAYHFRRQRHRGDGQGALQSGARGIANRQEILFGDRDVFKRNLVEFARFVDGRERGDRQAARAAGHDKQAQVRAAARRANQEVRSGGIRHEHLPAIEREARQRGLRVELHGAGIPTGGGFQQRERGVRFAQRDAREILPFLGGIAGRVDGHAGQQNRGKIRSGQQGAAHFFERDGHLDQAEAQTSVLFIEDDAGPALVRHLLPQRRVGGGGGFHQPAHFGDGANGREKLARRILQYLLGLGQSELHGVFLYSSWASVALGQSQDEVADDVALDLGRAGFDGVAARAQIGVGPLAAVEGEVGAARQLAVWPEQLHGHLLEALIQLAPEDLLNRPFRTGLAGFHHAADGAHLVEAHDFDFGVALRQLLADDRVLGGGPSVAFDAVRQLDQARELAFEGDLQAGAQQRALVHQGAERHVPTVVNTAHHVRGGHAHVFEEQLVEFRFAGHLAERVHFGAGTVRVDQQHGEAFMFFGAGIGAHHQLAPIGGPAVTGPDLLTGYNEVIAIEGGFGAQSREVGAGVGLGESLAPDLLAAEDFGEIALLLGFGAEGDEGGAHQFQAQNARQGRRSDAGHFFGEDGLLHEGGTAAAVFLGPGEAGPAALIHLALQIAEEGEAGFHRS